MVKLIALRLLHPSPAGGGWPPEAERSEAKAAGWGLRRMCEMRSDNINIGA